MGLSKRARACRFSKDTMERVFNRDGGCVFCRMGYHLPPRGSYESRILDIMHIVNRSQGGLGIDENGATGCRYHHHLLDNGNKGLREEMLGILEQYMRGIYPGWNRKALVYKKGVFRGN